MWRIFYSFKAALRFRGYSPQPVTFRSAHHWIGQFDRKDRRLAGSLLDNIVYFSEDKTKRTLLKLNDQILQRLANDGVPAKKVVYVTFDDTASSSHMMLGMLRDRAALLQRGCNLHDAKDVRGLKETGDRLENGAIIYIDDFIGSARQFCKARDFVMQFVPTTFVEFMLAPSVCEEGQEAFAERGIEVVCENVHKKADRALHAESTLLNASDRSRALRMCNDVNPKMALGVQGMATMVVFYRNSPNQIPAMFRGNKNLKPYRGLFPRTTDLPFRKIVQQPKRKSG
jgi:hypothetical protein